MFESTLWSHSWVLNASKCASKAPRVPSHRTRWANEASSRWTLARHRSRRCVRRRLSTSKRSTRTTFAECNRALAHSRAASCLSYSIVWSPRSFPESTCMLCLSRCVSAPRLAAHRLFSWSISWRLDSLAGVRMALFRRHSAQLNGFRCQLEIIKQITHLSQILMSSALLLTFRKTTSPFLF